MQQAEVKGTGPKQRVDGGAMCSRQLRRDPDQQRQRIGGKATWSRQMPETESGMRGDVEQAATTGIGMEMRCEGDRKVAAP